MVDIREKADPLAGFVFVLEGAQTLLGKLNEDAAGHPYLEPVYVYRVVEEFQVDEVTKKKIASRKVRELHPLFGYPEIRRFDLRTAVGTSVNDLMPASRDELAMKVTQYEEWLRSIGVVTLVKPRSLVLR